MKKTILALLTVITLNSCKKDYICVCTVKTTGEKSYGDHFKAGPYTKKAADESCEANDNVYSNDLENCHLE